MKLRNGLILLMLCCLFFGCKKDQSKKSKKISVDKTSSITVLSFGGAFAEAQRTAFFEPFQKATGIEVQEAEYGGEYGKIKAKVLSGNMSWDVVDIEASALARGIKEGLFLPLDYKVIDTSGIISDAINHFAIGTDLYSVSMGYNTASFPASAPQPQNWIDFWNTERFPGPRALKKDPKFTLEIALMADGVPLNELYGKEGLDVERAFRKLDEIKPHIKLWWGSGHEPIQALTSGEVVLAAAFGARIWDAKNKDGKAVDLTWNQSIIDIEYWAVLKGAKQVDLSMQFIQFATRPEQQAAFSKAFPLGPSNEKAFQFIDQQMAKELNTYPDNLSKQLIFNASWWAENEERIVKEFNEWLSS